MAELVVRCFDSMMARRQLGAKILVADFVIGALLLFGGILYHPVGPPLPPAVTVPVPSSSPNTFNFRSFAYTQPRALRWPIAAPLLAAAAVGFLFVVVPQREGRTKQGGR